MYIGIELARGVAALMVMLAHYAFMISDDRTVLSYLWTGVDLFFVISGFVFANVILSGKLNIIPFLIRRIFRIYPLYLVALFAYFMLVITDSNAWSHLGLHLFFLHTLSTPSDAFFLNPAFWSLPVEIEYYLVIPLLALFARQRYFLWFVFAVFILFKMFLVSETAHGVYDRYFLMQIHITGILPEFLIGIALYKLVTILETSSSLMRKSCLVTAFVLGGTLVSGLAYFFIQYGDEGLIKHYEYFGGLFSFLSALGYSMLLLPLCFIDPSRISMGASKVIFFVGGLSYSVYLLHNLPIRIASAYGFEIEGYFLFFASMVAVIAVSVCTHKYIEEPARLYGKKLSRRIHKSQKN